MSGIMKMNRALLLVCALLASGVPAGAELQWPIDRPMMVTGTFGEFRGAHYHHGIDISTGGKTGFKIFSAGDGYVSSVMYQQWGIGYAVLVRHSDGLITLYGHLKGFSDQILGNKSVQKFREQIRNRKDFRVDFSGPSIPVRRGAVIGFSGDSGIGLEHFHFEVRKKDNEPVNPLVGFLSVPDRSAPVISSLSLVPLDPYSTVDGSAKEKKYAVVVRGRGAYGILGLSAPVVSGAIAVKINAYDRIGIKNNVAVYGADLFVRDRLAYRFRFDRIVRDTSHRAGLRYDYDASSFSNYTLYLYDRAGGEGIIRTGLAGESLPVRIVCYDAAGNKSGLVLQLKTGAKADKPAYQYAPNLFPRKPLDLASGDGVFRVEFPNGSALYDEMITLSQGPVMNSRVPGVTAVSGVYALAPTSLCLDKPARVSLRYAGADYRKVGVYLLSRNEKYFYCVGTAYDRMSGSFRVAAARLGKFFLARDDAPPRVHFRNGSVIRSGDILRIYVSDIGTGVALSSIVVKIDGGDVAWDYDPDRRCVEVLAHNPVWSKGKHAITISLSDVAGNASGPQSFTYLSR